MIWMLSLRLFLAAAILCGVIMPATAQAPCPSRVGVSFGASLLSIAAACGINVEALKAANPGIAGERPAAGTFVVVPRPAFPSATAPGSRALIGIAPPIALTARPGVSPTVILPPEPLPQRPLPVAPDFGDAFGQPRSGFGIHLN